MRAPWLLLSVAPHERRDCHLDYHCSCSLQRCHLACAMIPSGLHLRHFCSRAGDVCGDFARLLPGAAGRPVLEFDVCRRGEGRCRVAQGDGRSGASSHRALLLALLFNVMGVLVALLFNLKGVLVALLFNVMGMLVALLFNVMGVLVALLYSVMGVLLALLSNVMGVMVALLSHVPGITLC